MKVVVIEPLGIEEVELKKIIAKNLPNCEIELFSTKTTDTLELIDRAKDAEIVVEANLPLTRQFIENCPQLKMISVAFTGVDHIDLEACQERGIMICNSVGYSTVAVADLVFGMIIELYRHISQCDLLTRQEKTKEGLSFYELEGKTIGIIGMGTIGERVAKIAQAFGMDVLGYRRHQVAVDGVKNVDLETLLKQSDIVSIHTPLTKETTCLIGQKELSMMKPTALLINTARGKIVDSLALKNALNDNVIMGAGIDVFETEPPILKNHHLLNCKNVILTPHIGFATQEALIKRANIVFENIKNYLEGEPQNIC